MDYKLTMMKDRVVIEVKGRVDASEVMSAGSFVRELGIEYPGTVILDVDGLEEQRELFYHVAFITAVKKAVEQAGSVLKVRAKGQSLRKYMNITGLKKLFMFDDPAFPAPAEA